jgi:alkylation response protein AidB-like acyl-CoA dehydrogenase
MDFGLTPEQSQLKDQVRRFLDRACPLEKVRLIVESEDGYDRELWAECARFGWQGLVVPAAYGGLGLKWEDLAVLLEETGRSLFPSPLAETAVAARTIDRLGSEEQKRRWLPEIAAGGAIATLAVTEPACVRGEAGVEMQARRDGDRYVLNGSKTFVGYGRSADLFLTAARTGEGVALFAVAADASGLRASALEAVDPTQRVARLDFEDVAVSTSNHLHGDDVMTVIDRALDDATVAACAEMVGAADAAVEMAAEYAKVRRQFGQPIGRFQGVKHTLAELHVAVESARSLTYFASWAVDNAADARAAVSMAKAQASEALDRAGEEGIQLHGAIGYTWECDAQLYYKRGRYARNAFGSPEYHYDRVLCVEGL